MRQVAGIWNRLQSVGSGVAGEGLSFVCNTDERVMELCELLNAIISSKQLKRSEGERLRGRLRFACGQLFGRFARDHLRILSSHIRLNRSRLGDDTLNALECIRDQIRGNIPRRIVGTWTLPLRKGSTQVWAEPCTTARATLRSSSAKN